MGSKSGVEAVLLAKEGITGKAILLEDSNYQNYVKSLGSKWFIYDLYFKFFSCCRWAQGALTAIIKMKNEVDIDVDRISNISVFSYGASGNLYEEMPTNETEAQYNLKYPIAVYLVKGEFGPKESSIDIDNSEIIRNLMSKISFHTDEEYESQFPGKRYTRVEINYDNGIKYNSGKVEPLDEPNSNVSVEEIIEKGKKINTPYFDSQVINDLIDKILNTDYGDSFADIMKDIISMCKV